MIKLEFRGIAELHNVLSANYRENLSLRGCYTLGKPTDLPAYSASLAPADLGRKRRCVDSLGWELELGLADRFLSPTRV